METKAALGIEAEILFCTQKRLQRIARPEERGERLKHVTLKLSLDNNVS